MDVLVLLLCGLPGAGKTTLAKKIEALELDQAMDVAALGIKAPVAVERVSFDELYFRRTVQFNPVEWKRVQEEMACLVQKRIHLHRSIKREGCLVLVVDDNFYYRSMRKHIFHLAMEDNCGFGIIHVKTSEEVCRLRNAERQGQARVPDVAFERMVEVYEAPDPNHSFEFNTIVADTDYPRVVTMVREALANGVAHWERNRLARSAHIQREQQKVVDQRLTAENSVHIFDLLSRQWISSVLKGEDPAFVVSQATQKAALAKNLNELRRETLQELKRGELVATNSEDLESLLARLRDDVNAGYSGVEM